MILYKICSETTKPNMNKISPHDFTVNTISIHIEPIQTKDVKHIVPIFLTFYYSDGQEDDKFRNRK